MANKKKRTEAQKAFQKERRRLLQAIRRGEKQGYIFQENIVPDLPKRVTKTALKRIQKTKPKDLYKTAEYLYQDTGEVVPAEQRKQEVKREATVKAKETKQKRKKLKTPYTPTYYPTISIIDTIRDRLSELTRESKPPIPIEARKNELLRIFEDTVTLYSDNLNELEHYLMAHESEIAGSLYVVSYDSNAEKVAASFVSLARLLNMQSLTPEQSENISAMSEYYNA